MHYELSKIEEESEFDLPLGTIIGQLERGLAKDEVAGRIRILRGKILLPQGGELFARHIALPLSHLAERLLALLLVQSIAGADQREFRHINAAIMRGILQIEHKVHVRILPVHHAAGILGIGVPHVAPLIHADLVAGGAHKRKWVSARNVYGAGAAHKTTQMTRKEGKGKEK